MSRNGDRRDWLPAPFRTLGARIAIPAGFFVLISVAALSFILIRTQREQVLAEVIHGSESIAQAILLSVDHDMRWNRREGVREMVEAAGRHEGIEVVRIFNKDGQISPMTAERLGVARSVLLVRGMGAAVAAFGLVFIGLWIM
ncbi:MAG TPA: hypothetical protein VMK65_08340 [Longimicrobiales bacterium]|nr:hypothetical protein [Longimicrobiales bacterium]